MAWLSMGRSASSTSYRRSSWATWWQKRHQAIALQGGGHHQVPQAHHVLPAAEIPGDEGRLPGKTTCRGFCWACGLPRERRWGYRWQTWPYNSSWWCLDSCRRIVSGQWTWRSYQCHRQPYHPQGASTPRQRLHHLWMGQTGSTWPQGPGQTSIAAPTRCWRGATRRRSCRWGRGWTWSVGTT